MARFRLGFRLAFSARLWICSFVSSLTITLSDIAKSHVLRDDSGDKTMKKYSNTNTQEPLFPFMDLMTWCWYC